jgi:hypothetical protein
MKQHGKDIFVTQETYVKEILKRFRMNSHNSIAI